MSIYKGEKLVAGGSADTHLVRRPAWNQAVYISVEALTGGYKAPADGMIVGILYTHGNTSTGVSLAVNGVEVARNKAKDSDHILNVQCPVGKGDIITISDEESQINSAIRVVPFEDNAVSAVEVVTSELIRNLHDPNWSQAVSITADQLGAGYTAPGRGIIVGWAVSKSDVTISGHNMAIKVNGVEVCTSAFKGGEWTSFANIQVPVNKNDVIKATEAVSLTNMNMSFVPYKAQ